VDLEINSSRVQSDVEERVRENRRKLETEIKAVLGETSAIADRALARARAVQASGATAVEAALAHLNSVEVEARRSFDSAVRFQELWQLSGYSWSHPISAVRATYQSIAPPGSLRSTIHGASWRRAERFDWLPRFIFDLCGRLAPFFPRYLEAGAPPFFLIGGRADWR